MSVARDSRPPKNKTKKGSKESRGTLRPMKDAPSEKPIADSSSNEIKIGMRLKHGRLVKGLRLNELAERLECSESYLSKVENDKVRPSLAMLHKIVGALDMTISQLFDDNGDASTDQIQVVRADDRHVIQSKPPRMGFGIALERLVATSRGSLLEANIHRIEPGGHTDGVISHEGEEIGYVLEGQIDVELDGVWYTFKKGDSFFFKSDLPHGYKNPGDAEAKILWVNTPLTF